jgi:hypothetical protein
MENELDRILNDGLASYGNCEPLAGLEERILSRIRLAERPEPRASVSRWAALTTVSALAVVGLFVLRTPNTKDVTRPLPVVTDVPQPVLFVPTEAIHMIAARKHPARPLRSLPKLPVFPTPTPLIAEEHRLSALMERDPQGTAEAFESLKKQNEPIEIGELIIEPLDSDGGQ